MVVLVLALVVLFCVACTSKRQVSKAANVLVICVDVLRPDHVGAYGYGRATTPSIDALALSGVVFEQAFSAASWTKPSVPSYFTGRFPHQHGIYRGSREEGGRLVSDFLNSDEQTLAELFRDAGYQTVAVMGNPTVGAKSGFSQGFDVFVEPDDQSAKEIRWRFLDWLDHADPERPFFSYLHFNDVHFPYDPPGDYRTAFGDGKSEIDFSGGPWKWLKRNIRDGLVQVSAHDRQTLVDLYDGGIKYADAEIGELMTALSKRGVLDDTLIVVLSDHGEELLDRGGIDHGSSLYDELLHVPLIFRFPGDQYAGLRVREDVSLVDLLPTLAEFAGFEVPAEVAGRSILALATGRDSVAARWIYSEGIHPLGYQQALRIGRWKYIATVPLKPGDSQPSDDLRPRLKDGLRVDVEGAPLENHRFLAAEVEIQQDQNPGRDIITGRIEEMGEGLSDLVVLGYRIRFTSAAKFQDHLGGKIDRGAFAVGDFVKVYGFPLAPDLFEAAKLRMRDPSHRKKYKLEGEIRGPVEKSRDQLVLHLAGREVLVDRKAEITLQGEELHEQAAPTLDPWREALERQAAIREELYDVISDPGEREDLSRSQSAKVEEMRSILLKLRAKSVAVSAPTHELDPRELEDLRSLGYLE
ncbi:MAG: sulfatase-like hydrolase/transferase [Candidatus Binatia bacterium]